MSTTYLSFYNGESFQIQIQNTPNLFIKFTIASGTLTATSSLTAYSTNGTLHINATSSGSLTISYPNTITLLVNGLAYSGAIAYSSSSKLTITWSYSTYTLSLESYPTQVSFIIGKCPLFNIIY